MNHTKQFYNFATRFGGTVVGNKVIFAKGGNTAELEQVAVPGDGPAFYNLQFTRHGQQRQAMNASRTTVNKILSRLFESFS